MSVFVAHSNKDKVLAREIAEKLRSRGVEVFLDEDSLPPGHDYDGRIRKAILSCEVFLFLASKASTRRGGYALTELRIARQRWPNPAGHVLPVAVDDVPFASLHPYLTQGVTVLRPHGNVAVETTDAVLALSGHGRPRRVLVPIGIGASVLVIAGLAIAYAWQGPETTPGREHSDAGVAPMPATTPTPTATTPPTVTSTAPSWTPPTRYLRLRNPATGACLITKASFEDEGVLAYTSCTQERQTLMADAIGGGKYHLVFEHSGMCLTEVATTDLRQQACDATRADQKWGFRPRAASPLFQVLAPSGHCIAVSSGVQGLQRRPCASVSAEQLFDFVE
jgi:hypothetical protein